MTRSEPTENTQASTRFAHNFSKRTRLKVLHTAISALFDDNIMILSAGIAFGGTLAFFPLVAACVAFSGVMIRPEQLQAVVGRLDQYLPADIASLVTTQITNAIGDTSTNIWVGLGATAFAIFGVSNAVGSVVSAVNIAYGLKETRNFLKLRLMGVGMTVIITIGMLIIVPLIIVKASYFDSFGIPSYITTALLVVRWPLLMLLMMVGLAIFYRYAPNRPRGPWQWLTWGSVVATFMWIAVTALFFVYLQNFANISNSYSLFAGIVALMMWLNFSGLVVLVGAKINRRLEHGAAAARRKNSKSNSTAVY